MKFVTLLWAAAIVSAPAAAQQTPPSARERTEGLRVLTQFADCAADTEPKFAARYVSSEDRLPEDEWRQLVDKRCLGFNGGKLRMDGFYFRGALAQRLLAKRSTGPVTDFANVPPLTWAASGDTPRHVMQEYALRLGECISRAQPVGARELFVTKVGSEAERGAISALAPQISGCVPPGEQVRINRIDLRTGMAVSYYRLVDISAGTNKTQRAPDA